MRNLPTAADQLDPVVRSLHGDTDSRFPEPERAKIAGRPSVDSGQLEASHVLKSGPGILHALYGYSAKVGSQFILVFDAVTLPADGAVPKLVIPVPAGPVPFSADFGDDTGIVFLHGIVVCNSTTGPTKTIGAADCWYNGIVE